MNQDLQKQQLLLKKIGIKDKIVKAIRTMLGYREGTRFIIDTEPDLKDYSDIELMKVVSAEERLKKALKGTKEGAMDGITENDAKTLLDWTVQNAREGIIDGDDKKAILNDSLLGACGLGQGITAITLKNMGLNPHTVNATTVLSKNGF